MFLKNAWYVAAWAEEITRDLQQIMVLGEKICVGLGVDLNCVGLRVGLSVKVCRDGLCVGFRVKLNCVGL